MSPRVRSWILLAGLVLATAAAYRNAAHDELVWDDKTLTVHEDVDDLDNVPELILRPMPIGEGFDRHRYRPLSTATLALERLVHAGSPLGYHVTSILLHVAATLAVFGLIRVVGGAPFGAFLGALVFGLHPIHTEVVAVAVTRSEILATLAVIAGICWVVRRGDRSIWITSAGAIAFYALALLSRESGATLPGLAILAAWLAARSGKAGASVRGALGAFAILLVPLIAYLAVRSHALGPSSRGVVSAFLQATGEDPAGALAEVAVTFRDYLEMLVWPWPLRVVYEDYVAEGVASAFAVHALLLIAAAASLRKAPAFAFGLVFFYVALLPSSQFFAGVPSQAERFLYLPSVGPAVASGFAFDALARWRGRATAATIAAPLMVVLALLTHERNEDWGSDVALWDAEARHSDSDGIIMTVNVSGIRIRQGRHEEALAIIDRGMRARPRQTILHRQRAFALRKLERYADAARTLEQALEIAPRDRGSQVMLARVYHSLGRIDEAEVFYRKAIEPEKDPAHRHFLLAEMLITCRKDLAGARRELEASIAADPEWELPRRMLEGVAIVEKLQRELGNRARPDGEETPSQ